MRKQIVAGNWKMNKTESETTQLIEELQQQDLMRGVEVFVAPTFVNTYIAVMHCGQAIKIMNLRVNRNWTQII